jgi:hypothetical protein
MVKEHLSGKVAAIRRARVEEKYDNRVVCA